MNKAATLVEYGAPIDAQTMVEPPDVTELELEPGHPGLGDEGYVLRRKELFALCRRHRLGNLGHVPPLLNRDYAELLVLIGKAVATTTRGDEVLALKRFSWFSIEFGLIQEADETKVFGAGILSSTGEIPNSLFSPDVTRQPFVTDVVIKTDYDPSRMQDRLFIAPSLPFLRRELEGLVR